MEISEEELKDFYEKNKDKFKIKEGKRIVLYKIDVEKLGKDKATQKAKEIFKNLKENKVVNDNSAEKIIEGVYRDNVKLPQVVKKEINKLKDDKNILFVKTDKEIYIGKYLGVGYSYKNYEDIKDELKGLLLAKKREKLADELYKKLEKIYKNKSLDELATEFNGNVYTFQKENINNLTLKYSINPIQLEKIFSKGKHLLKLSDKVLVLAIDKISFPSDSLANISQLKPLIEGMKQGTIMKMYLDKLKKNSDIKINPMLKEKLQ